MTTIEPARLPDRPYLDAAIGEIQDYHRKAEDYLAAVEERYDTGVREHEETLREVGQLRARVEELEGAPAVQRAAVVDLGPMWLHHCGTVGYGEPPTCGLRTLHAPNPWYPLYIGEAVEVPRG